MDFFIKKIFDKKEDEFVHSQFQKFSKGVFNDKAMIRIKNMAGKFNVNTTSEYAKELVICVAEELGNEKTLVKGALVSALALEGFTYKEKKSAIGINKYIIENEMTGNEIILLTKKVPKAFFGLSFEGKESILDTQQKSPKSSKGSSSVKKEGEKAKIDFCKLKTTNKKIIEGLIFEPEFKTFKSIEISHDYLINDILIDEQLKKMCGNDFAKLREEAKRKGKIVRKIDLDGKKFVKEINFEA